MRRWRNLLLLLGMLVVASVVSMVQFFAQSSSKPATVTPADYSRWKTEFRNWGRWGNDDERRTTNLITPATIVAVAQLVNTGEVISLAHAVPLKSAADVPEATVMITFAPLPVEDGTGSPVNPLAIF